MPFNEPYKDYRPAEWAGGMISAIGLCFAHSLSSGTSNILGRHGKTILVVNKKFRLVWPIRFEFEWFPFGVSTLSK